MLLRACDEARETVDIGGRRRYAVDERMADETDLVEVVSEMRNDVNILELQVALIAALGIDETMRAGDGAHHKAAIGTRQLQVPRRVPGA